MSRNQSTAGSAYFLGLHEWIAVIIITSILISISFVAIISGVLVESTFDTEKIYIKDPKKQIKITGAVEKPGLYDVQSATTVEDAVLLAVPLARADLQKLPLKTEIGKKRVIHVPVRAGVVVNVTGAVKVSGELEVSKGTKMNDLIGLIDFEDDADRESLNKKRKLKEGEQIVVPRKVENNDNSTKHKHI